jgi:magnesium transporter
MSKSLKYASEKAGLEPGSLVHVGDVFHPQTRMTVIDYGKDHYRESQQSNLEESLKHRDSDSITWVIIEGLGDANIVEAIGEHFNIHPLVLEDILNTHQRPKLEEHDDYLYIVLKSLMPSAGTFAIDYEQVSLLVLDRIIITFKEKTDELLTPVQTRLKNSRGKIRSLGIDYLMYAILDNIVDQNFHLLDKLEESLSDLEDQIFTSPGPSVLNEIQGIKREIINMRRYISPVRDLVGGLLRSESGLIDSTTHIYLRDVHDHILRIIESLETHRDVLSSLLDIYLSSINSKMNEVMKVLTVFASIFIPLTFITGIYGMNFQDMPELTSPWGYPAIWATFITVTIVLLVYFKRKRWM